MPGILSNNEIVHSDDEFDECPNGCSYHNVYYIIFGKSNIGEEREDAILGITMTREIGEDLFELLKNDENNVRSLRSMDLVAFLVSESGTPCLCDVIETHYFASDDDLE